MAWVKLDDKMPRHPKLLAAGYQAFALDVAALCYANEHTTGGHIPAAVLPAVLPGLPNPKRWAQALVDAGRWTIEPDGWRIHDYHDYQPTPDQVEELRKKRAAAGRLGGKRSGESRRKQLASGALGSRFDSDEAKPNPVPVPVPEEGNTPASSRKVNPPPNHVPKRTPTEPTLAGIVHDEARAQRLPLDTYWTLVQTAVDRHIADGAPVRDPVGFGVNLVRDNDPILRLVLDEHRRSHPPDPDGLDQLAHLSVVRDIEEATA